MLREIAWYIESGRYSGIASEIDGAIQEYKETLSSGSEKEQRKAREMARAICENHTKKSGFNPDATFINIDVEFFNGKALDETALDLFIKEIIKAHGYQRILWTYMGTTGSMTAISRNAMETEGLDLDSYLPASIKQQKIKKQAISTEPNTVPIYVYSDGSINQTYDRKKARLTFDALKDSSGFNWNKGYDPNDTIIKDTWFGAFDNEGTWTRIEKNNSKEQSHNKSGEFVSKLMLIKNGNTAILHDPGNLLLNPAHFLWLTSEGQEYGVLETSPEDTINSIRTNLQKLGVTSISGISCNSNKNLNDVTKKYKKILGDLATDAFSFHSVTDLKKIETAEKEKKHESRIESILLGIDRQAALVASSGISGTSLIEALQKKSARMPLSIYKKAEARSLGLSDKEASAISQLSVPSELKQKFDSAITNIFSAWSIYQSSGLTREETAQLLIDTLIGSETKDKTLTVETTFKELITGDTLSVPGKFGKTTPPPNKADFQTILEAIPPATGSQGEKNEHAISRVIENWNYISESTGMTKSEAISEAIRLSGGNPGAAAIQKSGYITPNAHKASTAEKRIFFELPVQNLVAEASIKTIKDREVSIQELEASFAQTPELLIIGGSKGKPLNEGGLDAQVFSSSGYYNKSEAQKASAFLHSWRITENATKADITILQALIIDCLKPSKGRWSTAAEFKQRALATLDTRSDVRYNLITPEGLKAAQESTRYAETGIQKEIIDSLIDSAVSTSNKNAFALHTSITIEPVLHVKSGTPAITKKNPRGIPENVHPQILSVQKETILTTERSQDTTILTLSGTVISPSLLHSGGTDLPTLIFGSLPSGEKALNAADLIQMSTAHILGKGYSSQEAEKIQTFLSQLSIPADKKEKAAQEIIPIIRSLAQKTTTAKEFQEKLIQTLESRSDVAFNLTEQSGNTAWKSGTQFLLSGLQEGELSQYIANTQTPVYARTRSSSQPGSALLSSAHTRLDTEETFFEEQDAPAIFIGGNERSKTENFATIAGIDAVSLRNSGYTAKEASRILLALEAYHVDTTHAQFTQKIKPELNQIITTTLKKSTTAGQLNTSLESALASRSDVAYNLTEPKGRKAYTATEQYKNSGLKSHELTRVIHALGSHKEKGSDTPVRVPVYARTQYSEQMSSSAIYSGSPEKIGLTGKAVAINTSLNKSETQTQRSANAVAINTSLNKSAPQTQRSAHAVAINTQAQKSETQTQGSATSVATHTMPPKAAEQKRKISERETPEQAKMRRIQANYEHDKKALAREKEPALARSASHDIGHAVGTGDGEINLHKTAQRLGNAVQEELKSKTR